MKNFAFFTQKNSDYLALSETFLAKVADRLADSPFTILIAREEINPGWGYPFAGGALNTLTPVLGPFRVRACKADDPTLAILGTLSNLAESEFNPPAPKPEVQINTVG